ncbi:AP-4 complex accessory subunit tepsin [Gastrophryne carolinensis]
MAVLERLTFLQQLPLLLKGTSDDETPCPGYLYQEMAKIAHQSPGSSQCLLEYLLNRLQNHSCHVKLKVLKILLYLRGQGPALFLQDLQRNVAFIQEAAGVSGPPDPLHGMSLYQKVRSTAQELVSSLFMEHPPHTPNGAPAKDKTPTGMGSQAFRPDTLQGFGYSQDKSGSGTTGEGLLSGIQRAAVAVTQAVMVGSSSPVSSPGDKADNAYKPVAVPLANGHPPAGTPAPGTRSRGGRHRSGVPGGGWDDSDSGHSSQDSMQEKSSRSLSSDAGSKSGSDGQSRGSNRESAETAERAETSHPGDCLQEAQLVVTVTRGQKVFLTQEEVQHFIRGCSRLNCEVVFEMLNRSLDDNNPCVKLRSMCAITSLMTSDLLTPDHMMAVVRDNLQKLSRGPAGPVMDKAKKILLQFEALTRRSPRHGPAPPPLLTSSPPPASLDLLNDAVPPSAEEEPLLEPSCVPASPALDTPPCCVTGQTVDSMAPPGGTPPAHGATGGERLLLFAGMDLVTPVRSTTITSQTSVLSQHRTASAFSFLNT